MLDLVGVEGDYAYDSAADNARIDAEAKIVNDLILKELQDNTANDYTTAKVGYLDSSHWLPTLPVATCSGSINTSIFGRAFNLDPCEKLQPLRDVLAWVFSILAILSIFRTTFIIHES